MNAATFRDGASTAERGHALNRAEARLLYDPSPAIDSLAEDIATLHRFGVPAETIEGLLRRVRRAIALNDCEANVHGELCELLDDLARAAHGDTLHRHASRVMTVKAIAKALRPALGVIAAPREHDAMAFVKAVRTIDRLVASHPLAVLLTDSVRNEIGPRRFDLFERLVRERVS